MFNKHWLDGIQLNTCTRDEVILAVDEFLQGNECKKIMFLNLYAYTLAQQDSDFLAALNSSHLLLNDGLGVSLLSKRAGIALQENLNGTDLIPFLLARSPNAGVFLLGAKPGIAKIAGDKLAEKGIKVCQVHQGYFKSSDAVVEKINKSGAKILVLGMGMPLQEKWLQENAHRLKTVKVAFAGGAIIDYMSGTIKRSPDVFVKLKLEWLYRMARQPKRLFKRNSISLLYLLRGLRKIKKVK